MTVVPREAFRVGEFTAVTPEAALRVEGVTPEAIFSTEFTSAVASQSFLRAEFTSVVTSQTTLRVELAQVVATETAFSVQLTKVAVVAKAALGVELTEVAVVTSGTFLLLEAVEVPLSGQSLLGSDVPESSGVVRVVGILQSSAKGAVLSENSVGLLVVGVVRVSKSFLELLDSDGLVVERIVGVVESLLQARMPDSSLNGRVVRVSGVVKSLMESLVMRVGGITERLMNSVVLTGMGAAEAGVGLTSHRGSRSGRGCRCHWSHRSGGCRCDSTSLEFLSIEEAASIQRQLRNLTSNVRNLGGNITSFDIVLAGIEGRTTNGKSENASGTIGESGGEDGEFSGELHD